MKKEEWVIPAPHFCLYENLAIVARFRGALAVSVEGNKKILTC